MFRCVVSSPATPRAPACTRARFTSSAGVPVLALALTPCSLGIARAALEALKQRLPGRTVAYTQDEVQIDMPVTHVQAAQAATKIDVAEALLYRCADDIEAAAERGQMMEFTKRARVSPAELDHVAVEKPERESASQDPPLSTSRPIGRVPEGATGERSEGTRRQAGAGR